MRYFIPDMTAGNAEKKSNAFGLQYAKYIESQWMTKEYNSVQQETRRLRDHMMGRVDASHLRPMVNTNEDMSTLAINWKYNSQMARFITGITESFSYDMYRSSVEATDAYSKKTRSAFKKEKRKDMIGMDATKMVEEAFGYDMMPEGYVPKSEEELNLYMALEYKMAQEIASEIGIQKVLDYNDWREVYNNNVEDLALTGDTVVAIEWDRYKGVNFRYVPIENFLYSRDAEHSRDARGRYYYAEVRYLTINEIEKLTGGQMAPELLAQLAAKVGHRQYTSLTFDEFSEEEREASLEVLSFTFKTNLYKIRKKKGNKHGTYKWIDKDDDYQPNIYSKSEVEKFPREVWMSGLYVTGTEVILEYGVNDKIIRDENNSFRKAIPPYIMYSLSTESIGRRIASISDEIYLVDVKLRQLISKMKPKGYAIDVDGLGNLEMADGQILDTIQQVKIFRENGDLLYSGKSLIDDTGSALPPIHNLPDATGKDLSDLVNFHNKLMQDLYEVTGINPQALGAAPASRTSTSVYQGTLSSSQKVVNNIFNGLLSIQERAAEAIISRLQEAAVHKETEWIIDSMLGEHTTDVIQEAAKLNCYTFAVTIDVKATDEDKLSLREDLTLALQTGAVSIEDKIDIEEIDNLKLARQMIKIRQKQNKLAADKAAQAQFKQQMALQEQKAQAEMQSLQMSEQIKLEANMAIKSKEAEIIAFQEQAKMQQIQLQGQIDMAIAQLKAQGQVNADSFKEKKKDERSREEKSMESKNIKQRQTEGEPNDFTVPEIGEGMTL